MEHGERKVQKKEAQTPMEAERTRNQKVYAPAVDIYEAKEAMVVIADMPGVDDKSVDITLDKNVLTITGTVEPASYKGYSIVHAEYDVGDYERAFTISDEVDRDRIEASVKNGVVRLTLPKAERVKAKKIAVKTG